MRVGDTKLYFYVDESGHTGANLFDDAQPMLYYGVLSAKVNVDVLAESALSSLRKKLGVPRLHAAEIGNVRLASISEDLVQIQKKLDFRMDVYRVAKPDHAVICFFDQVFDQGMNPAVTWTGYWTPLRYVLLLKLASLFDEQLARIAWEARTCPDDLKAHAGMREVCQALLTRLDDLPDARSRQLIGDALTWADQNPSEINYNVSKLADVLQITPNVIGFQSVMHGIAARIGKSGRKASKIIVDQQTQFNKAQRTLADFYKSVRGVKSVSGPGMPVADFKHMPAIPIQFASSSQSAGLELVDVHLWIFKRILEKKDIAPELYSIVRPHLHRGRTDEISLNAIASRWTKHFENVPQLEEFSQEQLERARKILEFDEARRQKAIRGNLDLP
jgi:hypothetical protein